MTASRALTALLALSTLANACKGGGGAAEEAAPPARVPVRVAEAAMDTIADAVTLVGRLVPSPGGSALLTAPAPGVVRDVSVQVGQRVSRGTPLVRLDVPDVAARTQEAAAAAAVSRKEANRQADLLKQGITSEKAADEAAAAAIRDEATARSAQTLAAQTRVVSPIAGVVQRVAVNPGERVAADAPLVEVVDARSLDLSASVPAAQLGKLRVGMPARVMAEGAGQSVVGRVHAIAPRLDSLTNAGQVVVRVNNADGALRAGTAATAAVEVERPRARLVVPDSALTVDGDSTVVFVVGGDSVAHRRPVTVAVRRGQRVAIEGDVKPGDRVVTQGALGLQDSTHVVPQAPGQPRATE